MFETWHLRFELVLLEYPPRLQIPTFLVEGLRRLVLGPGKAYIEKTTCQYCYIRSIMCQGKHMGHTAVY